jgi:replicative DNA helicase
MPEDGRTPLFGAAPRLPPSNVEAEQALLGSLLANNARTAERCEFLKPEHFADPVNARIYDRAMARIAAGQVADPVVLKSDFENTGTLDDVGGTKYLVSLLSAGIGWLSAGEYARAIYDTWLRRELIYAGEDVTSAAYGDEPGADVQKMLDNAA